MAKGKDEDLIAAGGFRKFKVLTEVKSDKKVFDLLPF